MDATAQARASIISTLGLPANESDWTFQNQTDYNRALATYIVGNAYLFTDAQVSAANASLNKNFGTLADTSFTGELATFGNAFVDEVSSAGSQVAGIGQGVLNLASISKYLIPLAGVAAIVILLFAFKKKVA